MTIELVTTTEEEQFVPATTVGYREMGLPVLRLNSVTMEEYLRDSKIDAEDDNDHDQGFASNYNSSDGEAEAEADIDNKGEEKISPKQNPVLPQETQHIRRDSGSSDDGISDEEKTAEIIQKLIAQVEQMFSDEHLAKDGFLLKHVRRRSDGYVSLKLVAGLRKVKQISRDFPTILAALRLSLKLDVNLDGSKIRRMEPLSPALKSLPLSGGNKEKEPTNKSSNSNNNQNNKKNSKNTSNPGSRNGSFSKPSQNQSPADLFYRNVHALSSGDESSYSGVNRRRGGSLPIPMNGNTHANHYTGGPPPTYYNSRNSMYLSPNASPPNGNEMPQRPKSNSYCEGAPNTNSPSASPSGMSAWLQQRRMASTRSSEGSVELNGVIRQPRGPDGTKGFAPRNTCTTVIEV